MAIPADNYESAQEILVVMNPPVGQLVADVPNKKPAECWTYRLNRIMCDNSNNAMILIIYIYIYIFMSDSTLNMSYVNHYLNNFCYLQDNYRLDITAILTRDILKCKA